MGHPTDIRLFDLYVFYRWFYGLNAPREECEGAKRWSAGGLPGAEPWTIAG